MSRQQKTESGEIEARWDEFWRDHKDFDSFWARALLHDVSEFLPFVFKFDAVQDGIEQLYVKSDVHFPPDFDWSLDWTGVSEQLPATTLAQLPIFQLALALRAYAYYGLVLNIDDNFHGVFEFLEHVKNH